MRKTALVLAAAGLLALVALPAASLAKDPSSAGHSVVAVSPDGKTVVTGGASRALYVLDADTLSVKSRIWIGGRIGTLCFNRDGTRLVVEDDEETTFLLDTADWKVVLNIPKTGFLSCAPLADCMAAYRRERASSLVFLSMTDGKQLGSIPLAEKLGAMGLSADGKKCVILTEAKKEGEDVVASKDIPADVKGFDRNVFQQKHDGRTCVLFAFDVPSGNKVAEAKLWFTTSLEFSLTAVKEDAAYVYNYANENAKIAWDGTTTLFQTLNGCNYGIGFSGDQTCFLSGGLRDGCRGAIDGSNLVKFQIDKLPGWPEYFEGFGFHSDGTGYGVTSAFRVAKIGKDGKILLCVPVV
jgi:WD40 repeat protein